MHRRAEGGPDLLLPHMIFDLAASLTSLALTYLVWKWRLAGHAHPVIEQNHPGYAIALVAGAALGGFGFGTLNLMLSGQPGIGRSILGAMAGAILAVELYKAATGTRGSTGLVFVFGFSAAVAVGRLGCFFSGLEDQTHGTPSSLPWAVDLGDGIPRHPVQLYESAAMALFLAFALIAVARRWPYFLRNGFYLMTGVYALQRFFWEFFKPYGTVLGPLNIFHVLCLALICYAAVMLRTPPHVRP